MTPDAYWQKIGEQAERTRVQTISRQIEMALWNRKPGARCAVNGCKKKPTTTRTGSPVCKRHAVSRHVENRGWMEPR